MAELQKVDDWLSALLANLEPAARSRMMRQLAQELRRTQQQNIRMGKKKTDQGNLRLLAARELRQPFPFIFFGKSETSEEPVIFLFPGETFPIPFVRTWTGFKKFFLHGNGGVRKSLLTEQAGGQGSRSKDSLCLGMIITVKGKFSRQKSKEC